MQSDRDLLRQALEALEEPREHIFRHRRLEAITAMRERLAQHTTRIVTDVNGRKHITNEPRLRE